MVCIKMGMNIEHEILDKLASDMIVRVKKKIQLSL